MDKSPYLAQAIQELSQPMAPIRSWGPDAGQLRAMATAAARKPPTPGTPDPAAPGAPDQQIGSYLDRYGGIAPTPGAPPAAPAAGPTGLPAGLGQIAQNIGQAPQNLMQGARNLAGLPGDALSGLMRLGQRFGTAPG